MGRGLKGRPEGSGGIDLERNSYETCSRVVGSSEYTNKVCSGILWPRIA